MPMEHEWPLWASELFETIVASIESKGIGRFQGAYYEAEESEDTHQIEVAPALAQLFSILWSGLWPILGAG